MVFHLSFYLYMLGLTFHLVPGSLISLNTDWGSLPQCKLIYRALYAEPKKEGQNVLCKSKEVSFPINIFPHTLSK